jgi:hypothetical protein
VGDFTVWLLRKKYPQISLVWVTEDSAVHEELLNRMPPDHYPEIYGSEDKKKKHSIC